MVFFFFFGCINMAPFSSNRHTHHLENSIQKGTTAMSWDIQSGANG